jgi:hypothetical protein
MHLQFYMDSSPNPHTDVASSHRFPNPYIYSGIPTKPTPTRSRIHKQQVLHYYTLYIAMSPPDTVSDSPESDVTSMIFKDTELTLGLPGDHDQPRSTITGGKSCTKRGFIETVDLNLGASISVSRGKTHADVVDKSQAVVSGACKPPAAK